MFAPRSLDERIQMVILYSKFENANEVLRQWKNYSDSPTPTRQKVLSVFNKFKESGSVQDIDRSGRPRTARSLDNIENVKNLWDENPNTSTRRVSLELGISATTVRRVAKEFDVSIQAHYCDRT